MKGLRRYYAGKVLRGCCIASLLAGWALLVPSQAQTIYGLTNANSTIGINVDGGGGTSAGMSSWSVDGFGKVKQQWFYYRIGDSGGEQSIDSMGNLSVAARSDMATLDVTYSDLPTSPTYQARVQYTLTGQGNGSGGSHLQETVTFYNRSTTSSLVLRFFDYSDFDLAGGLATDSVTMSKITGKVSFAQTNGLFWLTDSATYTPLAGNTTHLEANNFSSTLQSLTNGSLTTLNDVTTKSGDVTAAMEWDVTLAPTRSLQISKLIDMVVPEPSTASLLGLGLIAWTAFGRNRARFFHRGRKE
jgi:hypothetical protein